MSRIGIFGWGVVAPRSPNVDAFRRNLESSDCWLTPFEGFGPSTFLVGDPDFDFEDYKPWIDERFPPNKFPQLAQKMGLTTQYAIGAFVQCLEQNPGIEGFLHGLGPRAQVLVGTGVGEFPTQYRHSVELYFAQREWDAFWADAERNADRRRWQEADAGERDGLRAEWGVPADPREVDDAPAADRRRLEEEWDRFWMRRSERLGEFLHAFNEIEGQGVSGEVESGKLGLIRHKRNALTRLIKKHGCPTPPWMAVSPNMIWNIANTPAAQISMMGKITGATYAPIAACSSFGVALKLAMQAIRAGEAVACVIGMADPPPHPLTVGAFYQARVLAADRSPSLPLTDFRGTHVSGGACCWIVGDFDVLVDRGFEPVGLEILGVGITSDADHIITPSAEGPQAAIRLALEGAGVDPGEIGTWDLHATATPGDYQEVETLREIIPGGVTITARKGTFGHGMAVGGGWELTAQHMGLEAGALQPTPITAEALNPAVGEGGYRYVLDTPCPAPAGAAGKLSMGIGGINACVISRRWEDAPGS